jgi:hypothetical protein
VPGGDGWNLGPRGEVGSALVGVAACAVVGSAVLLLVTFVVATNLAPQHGSRSFYEASAQIIPVLILRLAIEGRAFEWNPEWSGWANWWADPLTPRSVAAASRVVILLLLIAHLAAAHPCRGGREQGSFGPFPRLLGAWFGGCQRMGVWPRLRGRTGDGRAIETH